jgi:lysophospholipid acyltransferase
MGGFITTAARLARSNIRPLLLPGPGSKPSTAKIAYDIAGTLVSTAILNYAASPFMLLSASNSFTAWSHLGYYGHIIIGGGLVFFYAGGTKYFRHLQKERGIIPSIKASANASASGNNGQGTPVSEKTFTLPPAFDTVIPFAEK